MTHDDVPKLAALAEYVLDIYHRGDLDALRDLLGNPPNFPNCKGPRGARGRPLDTAIACSPFPFIRKLLELGADPSHDYLGGYPPLILALSCEERPDRYEIVELLLSFGADIQQRGMTNYTPLHYAASVQDIRAIHLLLEHGADMNARTNVDDFATPLEEAEMLGREESVAVLTEAQKRSRRVPENRG